MNIFYGSIIKNSLCSWTKLCSSLPPHQYFVLMSMFFKSMLLHTLFSSTPKPKWMEREMRSWLFGLRALVSSLISPSSSVTILHTAWGPQTVPPFSTNTLTSLLPLLFPYVRTIIIVQNRPLLQLTLYIQNRITPSKKHHFSHFTWSFCWRILRRHIHGWKITFDHNIQSQSAPGIPVSVSFVTRVSWKLDFQGLVLSNS